MLPCCEFPSLNSALPPTSLLSTLTASWFNFLSANDFSDGGSTHWMRGQRDKHLFIHISVNQTKLTFWQDSYLLGGEWKSLIKTGNEPDHNIPIAFTTNKTAQVAQDHMDLPCSISEALLFLAACAARFVRNHKTQLFLEAVWCSDAKFWPHAKPSIGYLLPSMSFISDVPQSFIFKDISNSKNKGTNLAVKQ